MIHTHFVQLKSKTKTQKLIKNRMNFVHQLVSLVGSGTSQDSVEVVDLSMLDLSRGQFPTGRNVSALAALLRPRTRGW